MHKTVVVAAVALFAAGCSTGDGTGDPQPGDPVSSESVSVEPLENRPTYVVELTESEFCPEGGEIEELESTPENTQIVMHHNASMSVGDNPEPETENLSCPYFYVPTDADEAEQITVDFATPDVEMNILDERIDPGNRLVLDSTDFPEFPDYFQITGWDHTATEEELNVCPSSRGFLYEECPDGQTLVKEVFTFTGFDANLDVVLKVEYRYAGDPAEYGDDEIEEIESVSRQMAADLLPLLIDRIPTAGE